MIENGKLKRQMIERKGKAHSSESQKKTFQTLKQNIMLPNANPAAKSDVLPAFIWLRGSGISA